MREVETINIPYFSELRKRGKVAYRTEDGEVFFEDGTKLERE